MQRACLDAGKAALAEPHQMVFGRLAFSLTDDHFFRDQLPGNLDVA
jgi:hypothetical protein